MRTVVDAAARAANAYQHELAAAEDDAMLAKLADCDNEVLALTASERAAFVAALAPVLDRYRRELDPQLFAMLER